MSSYILISWLTVQSNSTTLIILMSYRVSHQSESAVSLGFIVWSILEMQCVNSGKFLKNPWRSLFYPHSQNYGFMWYTIFVFIFMVNINVNLMVTYDSIYIPMRLDLRLGNFDNTAPSQIPYFVRIPVEHWNKSFFSDRLKFHSECTVFYAYLQCI